MIKLLILIVIVVVVLGYFGFSVEGILKSPQVMTNLEFIKNLGLDIFHYVVNHMLEGIKKLLTFITSSYTKATN